MRVRVGLAAVLGLAVTAGAGAFEVRVRPGESLPAAVEAARASQDSRKIVLLAPGVHRLSETLVLDERDQGLELVAEKQGTAVVSGGIDLAGWQDDGDGFLAADLPEADRARLDFRTLVVNGAFADRARYPGGDRRLENLGDWKYPLLPAVSGYWERKPTREELVTMPYAKDDIPRTMDLANADIRLYHMWAETLSPVASNDFERGVLYLAEPAKWPMGACNRRQYEILNVREGMLEPGQWYLDRRRGKVVYFPRSGEDAAHLKATAALLETIVEVKAPAKRRVKGVRLEGLVFEAATAPGRPAGFGGCGLPAAVSFENTVGCAAVAVEIRNVGGIGLATKNAVDFTAERCDVHSVGSRGVGIDGVGCRLVDSRISGCGLLFASASVAGLGGKSNVVMRCELSHGPYSGLIAGGTDHLIEDNLIHHVMQVLHDGAAIYGNLLNTVIRGNVVRDVVANGAGFGVSAYYLDEGSLDCTVERNLAYGVSRPVHNHIARGIVVRDNTFVADGKMTISFAKSVDCRFERNFISAGGAVDVAMPEAVPVWEGNRVYAKDGSGRIVFGDGRKAAKPQKRRPPLAARPATAPVVPDGEFAAGEWPGEWSAADRDARNFTIGGAGVSVRAAWGSGVLHVGVMAANFNAAKFSEGSEWGVDDGVEIVIAGRRFRGYANGAVAWDDPAVAAVAKTYAGRRKGAKPWDWQKPLMFEVSVPFSALGVEPREGLELPFSLQVHNHQYGEDRYWDAEGGSLKLCAR